MSDSSKKQTFLHGAALLALATAVVKLIGAFYKIPLKMVIGDQGYGYFSTAYEIYAVLLMISTAGLPVAMSRMISQANALGHNNQVRRVYKTAQYIFLTLGIISTSLMLIFAEQLAAFQRQPNAAIAIRSLAPCALLMSVIATYRGFFQGQENMRPTSVSQVLEALFKLLIGLTLAVLVMRTLGSVPLAAGAAIMGVTIGCLFAMLYLLRKFVPAYKELVPTGETPDTYGKTLKGLLAIAVPITLGSAGLQLLTVLETNLYMSQLLTSVGMSQETADITKGIYNMTQTIFNMPCAFIIPICVSVIPAISANLTLKKDDVLRETEESAARVTGLISLPCSVGLLILSRPVMALLGSYTADRLDLAAKLMAILGGSIFLYAIIQYTNSLLQAHGYAHVPVINMLVAGAARLVAVYFLVGNPNLGILGTPLGAALCYLAIAAANLLAIRKIVPQKPRLLRNFVRAVPPAMLMGAAVVGIYWLLNYLGITSRILLCGVPIALGAAVYALSVVLFKTITREDCLLLPKGEKIAKLLRL